MLTLDLTSGDFSEPDTDPYDDYPDEVLESEWNPVLTEIQSIQSSEQETSKPDPAVVEAALARLNRN